MSFHTIIIRTFGSVHDADNNHLARKFVHLPCILKYLIIYFNNIIRNVSYATKLPVEQIEQQFLCDSALLAVLLSPHNSML